MLVRLSRKHNISYEFANSSIITQNRNKVVSDFLKTEYPWLLFWDTDVVVKDEEFVDKLVETGYNLDSKVICGCYKIKDNSGKYPIALEVTENEKGETWINFMEGELKNPMVVDYAANGLMLIHRDVVETILQPWFEMKDMPGPYVIPEDWVFCKKARKFGFKVAVDPRIETHHYGSYGWKHSKTN